MIQFFLDDLIRSGITFDRVILFGSCATGYASDQSDIDIAIVSPQFQGLDLSARFHLLGRHIIHVVKTYHMPIDVIPLTPEEFRQEKSIRMDFIKMGRVLRIEDLQGLHSPPVDA